MPKKFSPPPNTQTLTGNDNVQIAGDNNVVNKITQLFTSDTDPQREQQIRGVMLERVKDTWIKGVLEKSLFNEVVIELGMEERPAAVERPWDVQICMPNQIDRVLPRGTPIVSAFQYLDRAMLILGEPGAGKTTMLLELARDTIAEAEQDVYAPIPVVLNLSSWSQTIQAGKGWRWWLQSLRSRLASALDRLLKRTPRTNQSIEAWIVSELVRKYRIKAKTAQRWIERDNLLLLLDGLDEVKLESREACVIAINEFRHTHGAEMPIAICSRIRDYEALSTQLSLQGAVMLQPLTSQQIEQYFELAGPELENVHLLVKNDVVLQELAKQPLMLSIITLAYQGMTAEALATEQLETTIITRRQHLFDTYINQMFERVRTKNNLYSREQTKIWLAWLAQKMMEHSLSIFLLEQIQRSWLQTRLQKKLHEVVIRPFCWLVWSVFSGLIFGWLCWQNFGIDLKRADLVAGGLFIGLINIIMFGMIGAEFEMQIYSSPNIKRSSIVAIITGTAVALFVGIADMQSFRGEGLDGLMLAPILGPLLGLYLGGYTAINHYTLRFLLYLSGYMPWNYKHFLNFADDRILLRTVGDGYIFVHRFLLEHFAAMYPETEK